ncbi:MAG: hypothetical protein GX595_09350 [Lentisphaerae bacterium]|nr:hypothetical protein [Lentisphaerota bacterium]
MLHKVWLHRWLREQHGRGPAIPAPALAQNPATAPAAPSARATSAAPGAAPTTPRHDAGPGSTIADRYGRERRLGALLAQGGEGSVYCLADQADALVKIYHPHVRTARRDLERKIEAMRRDQDSLNDASLAWPRIAVYVRPGRWVGYAMRRLQGTSLQTLCQAQLIRERLPGWTRRHLVRTALSFVEVLSRLHSRGVVVGDINPRNFLVDADDCSVRCLDCDSFQVQSRDEVFPCRVMVPEYQPPEVLNAPAATLRTVRSDRFAAAVMLFRILMVGQHPYNHAGGEDPASNLLKRRCPLGPGAPCRLPHGPWETLWKQMPGPVRTLFIQAFREGDLNPDRRPELKAWRVALEDYLEAIDRGRCRSALFPTAR